MVTRDMYMLLVGRDACTCGAVVSAVGTPHPKAVGKPDGGKPETIYLSFCLVSACAAVPTQTSVVVPLLRSLTLCQPNGMEVDREPPLNQLYRSISALNRSVLQHISEL